MVGAQVNVSVLFSVFVLIGNPLIVLIIMGVMGYRRRTGFLAGLTVAQISEFSLIVAALGLRIGHINQETMGLITLVGVVTIFVSTYLILYSGTLYRFLSKPLKIFERRNPYRETAADSIKETPRVDVILVGLGNYGGELAEYLLRRNKKIIGVDFDPGVLEKWRSRGIFVLYGDMADPELHEQLPLNHTRWVVSTIRSKELNLALLQHLTDRGYNGNVALTATNQGEVVLFEKAGARVIFRPFIDAAEQAADALTHAMDIMPENVNWPIALREVRIRSEASVAGQTIRNIPLRSTAAVSILAVSRAGRVHYNPEPDFRIYPGDRLAIIGQPEELLKAETMLNQFKISEDSEDADRFEIETIKIADGSKLLGQTLSNLRFRQKHEVTVVGIRRGKEKITNVSPTELLSAGDSLIIIGESRAVKNLKQKEPL